MSSNEEYLDNLLKSMDGDNSSQGANGADEMNDEDIDALFAAAERILNGELAEDEPEGAGVYQTVNASEDLAKETEAELDVEELVSSIEEEPVSPIEEEPISFMEEEPAPSIEEEQEAYQTVESTKDMSQEEIEALLASTRTQMEEAAEEAIPENMEDAAEADDLMALLGGLDSNEDLNAIGDLLEAADSGELPAEAEISNIEEAVSPDIAFSAGMEEEPAENAEEDGKKGKKKRERKPKKEKKVKEKREKKKKADSVESADAIVTEGEAGAAAEQPEKKKGLFSKLLTALTEEEENNVSDENQAIMQELEEEDLKEAGKKKKMKKGKKPAGGKGESDEDEEGGAKGKKKAKPKKEPKPKKQKEPKEPKEPEKPGKRISPKSIIVVVLFAATVFGGIFLAISLFSGELRMQSARDAFDQRDYMTCYEEMYGMDLNEEEEIMFRHAQIVLKVQRRIKIYEEYMGEGRELEALDSLMQAVADYDAMYAKAQECGAGPEVAGLYDSIIQILEDNYGVDQDAARAIALCQSNVDYTRYLTALIEGTGVSMAGSQDEGQGGLTLPDEDLKDVLPAEEELDQPGFAD
ncbi:MAG: hypothetical protein K2I22_04190 [Lachnospiraceae bacterium]|nr:hypothetical protein [Lachnospiraceae bacterium]